jgi:putative DNA primase/helicase
MIKLSKSTPKGNWKPTLSDAGNAELLAEEYHDRVRYCPDMRKWLAWDGRRWSVDAVGEVYRLALATLRKAAKEAVDITDERLNRVARNHFLKSEAFGRLKGMVSLAAHSPKLVRRMDQLDRDPMLLNCRNGTVELETGQLRQHRPADLLTKLAPVEFAAQAQCPQWQKFLGEIFDNQPELIAFMQRLLGYCLTGKVDLHVLPIFWGSGANGKSTLLNTVLAILGRDYASGLPRDLLLHSQYSGHPTGL